jgi:hypothetical protein
MVLVPLLTVMAVVYVLPTIIIAIIRQMESFATLLILNSFPITWPAVLVMACMLPRKGDHDR